VPAFTVGVTAARFEACKRGVAANYAAILAKHEREAVCLVDADPRSCDVGTRLAVSGASVRRFARAGGARRAGAAAAGIPRLEFPPLHVLPAEPGYVDIAYCQAYDTTMDTVRRAFDVVVVDLPVGAGRPGPTLDARLVDHVDVVVLTVTPDRAALAATLRYLELFATAQENGEIAPHVRAVCVITGDEGSTMLDREDVEDRLGDAVAGHVPQLWGRSLPNCGFGPTLGIGFLEAAVTELHAALASGGDHRRRLVTPARS
jgi:cellulose biosynthesis protein BcsQ